MEKNTLTKIQKINPGLFLRWIILLCLAVAFMLILYPNLIRPKPSYVLGDVVEKDIKAPKDFFIEDQKATEANRWLAKEEVLTVYDYDGTLALNLSQKVKLTFADMRTFFQAAPPEKGETVSDKSLPGAKNIEKKKQDIHNQIWENKKRFEDKLGFPVSKGAYSILEKEAFAYDISYFISQIVSEILENGVVTNKDILLRESEKGIILRTVGTDEEEDHRNLKKFYGLDQARAMVRIIGQPLLKEVNYNLRNLIVDFIQELIQPNITLNRNETEERRKKAVADVKPVLYKIKAGEMLIREGERITEIHLLMLKALIDNEKGRNVWIISIGAAMLILILIVTTYLLYINQQRRLTPNHTKDLLFTGCVFIVLLLLAQVTTSLIEPITFSIPYAISASSIALGIPIASGAMIVCLFLGLRMAVPFALILSVAVTLIFQDRLDLFSYFLVNGTMAAYWIQNCRERKVFIKAGLKLALLNMFMATAIAFYRDDFAAIKILGDLFFAFFGGIATGIVTAGIAPFGEIVFGYTSDIKLLELANLDQPILRRLMLEAPGTYHHSVIVGSMVEAAATEIGANPLEAKVCGYYHDIGKMKKPLYFIENQAGTKNRHDKLAPSMSSLILVSHVKDGVEIARRNKLGQPIVDTIQQHHGTCVIRYFYEKAVQKRGKNSINRDDFRYPGPKPQSREVAIVMLADVVEAASRAIENPTPSRIQGMVQKLTNDLFSEGQFDHCELTLKDLNSIAKSFTTILNAIYHHRIEYPEKPAKAGNQRKDKNGGPGRQSAKQASNVSQEDSSDSAGRLKRLGLS